MDDFFVKNRLICYKDKEIIIRADDNPQGVYYVKKGFVRMDALFENGTEVTFNIFKPGSFFPTPWAIGGIENSFCFTAMGFTEIYRASKNNFLKYIKSDPSVLFDLTKRIIIGTDALLDEVKNIIKGKASQKVAWTILMLNKRNINIKLTHQDIARIASVTRETASIEIEKLKRAKIISFRNGGIRILEPAILLNLSK